MATLIAIKTKYNEKMERVYNKLMTGIRKVADVTYRQTDGNVRMMRLKTDGGSEMVSVRRIGANSFGMEVYIKDRNNVGHWTALEQFSESQQLKIALAIEWGTLA